MNESEQRALEALKQRQLQLEQQLILLREDIRRLEASAKAGALQQRNPSSPRLQSGPIPRPQSDFAQPGAVPPIIAAPSQSPIRPVQAESATPARAPVAALPPQIPSRAPEGQSPLEQSPELPPLLPPTQASFELRLGTYWLVRIGAVLILTGLAFFGNLAYQKMGPGGKLALLYLASGLLLGAGTWWQRKAAKPALQNYAQVLFAGGLAAVYFTTYAAHHILTLRVIGSPLLDGLLLLGWAGFIAWIADRRKSELLALFATGLAYYTSVITPVGSFTLFSNLVLTVASVVFLVRNRWAGLSWLSLVATYAAYAWWRFFHGGEGWRWATPDEGLGFGASFLFSYWLVFTVAAFLSKQSNIAGKTRAAFVTFNNGALFSLFVLTMLQVDTGRFWQFSLGFGTGLLVLAELSRRFLSSEAVTKNTYLTQGLVLVTVGLVSKFTGTQLALILAAESVTLFILGTLRKNIFLQTGAYISGAMAVGYGIDTLERDHFPKAVLGAALGGMMAWNGCWSARRRWWADPRELRPEPTYLIVLALVMWVVTTWYNTTRSSFPCALAIESLLLTASIYALRVRELVLLGQGVLALAQVSWLMEYGGAHHSAPWWNFGLLVVLTLMICHWWQHQKQVAMSDPVRLFLQSLFALGLVAILHSWLSPQFSREGWMVAASAGAIVTTAYAVRTRLRPLAITGQIFVVTSVSQFGWQLADGHPAWYYALAPILMLVLLSTATLGWIRKHPDSNPPLQNNLRNWAIIYRWVAVLLTVLWVGEYASLAERPWWYALLGVSAFAWAAWRRDQPGLLISAVFWIMSFVSMVLLPNREAIVHAPNFLLTLGFLSQQQYARRNSDRVALPQPAHVAMICAGCLTWWWLLSHWVLLSASGFYLTASWSGLAALWIGVGVVRREKTYRWAGLAILAASLGRIIIFDVWKLETLYRVLSFMALGIVLVVLGFIYSKYQEKFREWL